MGNEFLYCVSSNEIIRDLLMRLYEKRTPEMYFMKYDPISNKSYRDLEKEILSFGLELRRTQNAGIVKYGLIEKLDDLKQKIRNFKV